MKPKVICNSTNLIGVAIMASGINERLALASLEAKRQVCVIASPIPISNMKLDAVDIAPLNFDLEKEQDYKKVVDNFVEKLAVSRLAVNTAAFQMADKPSSVSELIFITLTQEQKKAYYD